MIIIKFPISNSNKIMKQSLELKKKTMRDPLYTKNNECINQYKHTSKIIKL
jgi:hypothetical protein